MGTIPRRVQMTVLLLLLALSGCVQAGPKTRAPIAPETLTLNTNKRWLVSDPGAIIADLPPPSAELGATPEKPADPAMLAAWERPVSAWMQHTLTSIATDQLVAPQAARTLMLMSVTLNDSLQIAAATRNQGIAVNDDAVLAESAQRVLTGLFPLRATIYRQEAEIARWVGVWHGTADSTAVLNGQVIGAAVAEQVLAYAAKDGADTPLEYVPAPSGATGRWHPTPPDYMPPQNPAWMHVQTIAVGDPAELRVPPPPAWDSPAMDEQLRSFKTAQSDLSAEDLITAAQWAGEAGTVTPPGIWMQIAMAQVEAQHTSSHEAAAIFALLGVALHDAAITCWESKYHYNFIRPVHVIQASDPDWLPSLKTPPHPSYPSGHATFSAAAAGVLRAVFPEAAAELEQWADDAARSRVLGGIHWPIDGSAGLAQGYAVATQVLRVAGE
ncbi:MAG: vanadium-dependent haloperoxidase [Oscillochloris sp.]|nr:vanadium-dependent haloperoxidase [Oscillochloris sp.]